MKAIIIGAVIFCVALIGGGVLLATRGSGGGPRIIPIDQAYTDRMSNGYWARGNTTNPSVVIEEYADFQCPGCGAMHPVLEESFARNKETVKFVYRSFPLELKHNKARIAAQAAEAAGRQGKFWEMHQLLFANQQAWTDEIASSFRGTVNKYAEALNLDLEQFKKDMKDNSINDGIDADLVKGNQLPVNATPTLIINGAVVQNLPTTSEQLDELIEQAAAAAQNPS